MVSTASAEKEMSGRMSLMARRFIYWLFLAVFVSTAVLVEVLASRSGAVLEHGFLLISIIQAAFALLALWSIVFVRCEPVLVRIALFLMVVVSYSVLWTHRL
jgi:hypothetical protein